ncbi:MAG: caspase family protein [Rubrivivax sp.]|nr:caspase family protein [Rubrivivax sp.]
MQDTTSPPDGARRRLLAGLGGLPTLLATPAWAQASATRVALVLGNAAYARSPLLNPVRDARAMAELLRSLGFQVIEERDADLGRMGAAIERAATALQGRQGIGLLYYAGHGLQIDWRNYMLPVDIRIETAADVPRQSVDVQRVLKAFQGAGTRMNILMLDACRDNPFGTQGGPRGLAPMDAPPGTFFAYATAPGNVAEDGSESEGNGLYTRFLLQELKKPEARIEDVFKRVRLQVRQATQGRQIPWESTSLEEDFVFADGRAVAAPAQDERLRAFDEQRTAWARISASSRPEDFYAFIQRDPNGPFAELAQFALDRIAAPAVLPQAPQGLEQVVRLPPGADRYRVGDAWENRHTDHMADDAQKTMWRRVGSIEGQRVLIDNGTLVLDQMGSVIVNGSGRKDPGILFVPADLSVGKRWRSVFTNTPRDGRPTQNFYDHRVEALEDVTVPAGTFRAFRTVHRGRALRPDGGSKLLVTMWVDAATLWPVKFVTRREALHQRWLEAHTTDEMLTMRRLPR